MESTCICGANVVAHGCGDSRRASVSSLMRHYVCVCERVTRYVDMWWMGRFAPRVQVAVALSSHVARLSVLVQ